MSAFGLGLLLALALLVISVLSPIGVNLETA
jgi:hypothetical protein